MSGYMPNTRCVSAPGAHWKCSMSRANIWLGSEPIDDLVILRTWDLVDLHLLKGRDPVPASGVQFCCAASLRVNV